MSAITQERTNQENRADSKQPNRKFTDWCVYVFVPLLIMLASALTCFFFIRTNGINVPYMDEWYFLHRLQQFQTGHLNWIEFLNVQDSEHKVFVPFFLQLIIGSVTKYNDVTSMYAIYGFIALQCALLIALGWPLVRDKKEALYLLCPIPWIVFSIRSWENILWGLQLTITMCAFFVVATAFLLNRSRRLDFNFGAASITALCATYCIANGVTIWIVGFVQLLLQQCIMLGKENGQGFQCNSRDLWQRLIAWVALSIMVITNYIAHLTFNVHGPNYQGNLTPSLLRHDFPEVVHFLLACIGSPLSSEKFAAVGMGIVLAAIFVSALFTLFRSTKVERQNATGPMALILFAFGTIILVTYGRYGGGLDSALHSRYCTFTSIGLAGLYLLLLALSSTWTRLSLLRFGMLIGILCVGTIAAWQDGIDSGDSIRAFRLTLANAVRYPNLQSDDALHWYAEAEPSVVRERIAYLKNEKMSLFGEPTPPTLAGLRKTSAAPCFLLDTINSLPVHTYPLQKHVVIDPHKQPSLEFTGWAFDFPSRSSCSAVFVSIDNQLDIPTSIGLPRRELVRKYRRSSYLYSGFAGTCRSNLISSGLHAVTLKIISPDKKSFYQSGPLATLEIIE